MSSPWTDDKIETVKAKWRDGVSAGRIAKLLGPDFTRNAVIGKIHRLGLSDRPKVPSAATRRPRCLRRQPPVAPAVRAQPKPTIGPRRLVPPPSLPEPVPAPVLDVAGVTGAARAIRGLTSETCRWPMGDVADPAFRFCGSRPRGGRPYCEYHCRIAYQSVYERRGAIAEEAIVRRQLEAAE